MATAVVVATQWKHQMRKTCSISTDISMDQQDDLEDVEMEM